MGQIMTAISLRERFDSGGWEAQHTPQLNCRVELCRAACTHTSAVVTQFQFCSQLDWINSQHVQFSIVRREELYTTTATNRDHDGHSNENVNKKAVLSQRWPRNAPMRPIHGYPEIFGTPWLSPSLLFPTFFMGFCSDRSYECSYKIWSP